MSSRTASCSCGQLKITVTGEPIRVGICHCLPCQKRSGSAFAVTARWPTESTTIEGNASTWSRTGDSGSTAEFRFCPTCGSTVYWTAYGATDTIAVAVGAFAEPSFPRPTVSVYEDRKHSWVVEPEGIEHLH